MTWGKRGPLNSGDEWTANETEGATRDEYWAEGANLGGGASSGGMPHQLIGDAMIIGAQIIVAIQMVVEEKLVTKCDAPALQGVGW